MTKLIIAWLSLNAFVFTWSALIAWRQRPRRKRARLRVISSAEIVRSLRRGAR